MPITREQFISATGREPRDDDLDRCNCPFAGKLGHWFCGWDEYANRPMFDLRLVRFDKTGQRILGYRDAIAG